MSSASGSTLSRRLDSIRGMLPPGRSVRPIEPANSTSPERQICSASQREPAPGNRNSTDPPVWPGAWSTVISNPASDSVAPSVSSATSSGSAYGSRPPNSWVRSIDSALLGSASSSRSSGWT